MRYDMTESSPSCLFYPYCTSDPDTGVNGVNIANLGAHKTC